MYCVPCGIAFARMRVLAAKPSFWHGLKLDSQIRYLSYSVTVITTSCIVHSVFFGSFLVTKINLVNAHARMCRGGGQGLTSRKL